MFVRLNFNENGNLHSVDVTSVLPRRSLLSEHHAFIR